MRMGIALSWMLAACDFSSPKVMVDAGPEPDAAVDAGPCTSSFSAQLDTCKLMGGIPLTLSGMLTFNTDTGVLSNGTSNITVVSEMVTTLGGDVRALVATTVTFEPNTILRAIGLRGFAIVAHRGITLQMGARIDVSAGGAGHRGSCGADAPGPGVDDDGGASGGGGAGFGAIGGAGGNGDNDMGQSTGGAAGAAAVTPPLGPLGGCPGARGGVGDGLMNVGGVGGLGGGAVYLVSKESIGIATNGGIDASGGGGGGGDVVSGSGNSGGGGGGSGGSIFLEAPRIRIDGILAANGGGGGEGAGLGVAGQVGAPGTFGILPAAGGQTANGDGAGGGAGGAGATPAGAAPTEVTTAGGGGGGGGVGFIHAKSGDAQLGASVSPAAATML